MNIEDVKEIIKEALLPEEKHESFCENTSRSAVIRDGWQAKTINEYNFGGFQILDSNEEDNDWDSSSAAIISFDKGLALVFHDASWDYTFRHDTYELQIVESHNWEEFQKVCLTDDLRTKFKNLVAEMEILR